MDGATSGRQGSGLVPQDQRYSKKFKNHALAVALQMLNYNFIREHDTIGTVPAVAAGIARIQVVGQFLVRGGDATVARGSGSLHALAPFVLALLYVGASRLIPLCLVLRVQGIAQGVHSRRLLDLSDKPTYAPSVLSQAVA